MPAIAGPRYPLQGYTSVCDSFFRAWFKLEVGQPQIVVQEASHYKIVVKFSGEAGRPQTTPHSGGKAMLSLLVITYPELFRAIPKISI